MDGADLSNQRLGAYHLLLHPIGKGASGEVWEAVDERTGEHVAAKVLRRELAEDQDVVSGFLSERNLLVGLRHPSIVSVRDLVAEEGRVAIVMDLLDGGSLREVLDARQTLPPSQVAGVLLQVLDALAHARVAGVQHRDVKPDNVLLTSGWEGLEPGAVRLADFGVARLVEQNRHLSTGILGTPEYMSPELITTGRSGFPADVYAAGIVGYELLAGRTPFAGPGNDYSVAHRQVNAEPPRIRVPGALWRLLDAMLAKDPSARPSAATAAARLREFAGSLDGVAALPRQATVEDYQRSEHPGTVLRGRAATAADLPGAPDAAPSAVSDPAGDVPLPDLGTADGATILRPVSPRPAPPAAPVVVRPWWRRPWFIGLVAVLLVAAVVAAVLLWPHRAAKPAPAAAAQVAPVTQTDEALPTGLTVSRQATYDASQHLMTLAITYTAARAPLKGPFLEVVPGGQDCPAVAWSGATVGHNLPTATGIDADCGWSVDVDVPESGSRTVTARVPVVLGVGQSAVQTWLSGVAGATSKALSDRQVTGAAYPVQRLQSIEVAVPSGVLVGGTVPVSLVPVWPSGPDPVSPLLRTPGAGAATATLTAVAGGLSGVRLSDGCGQTSVAADGLTVTALGAISQCSVRASVGNFDVKSSSFTIATRGR